MTISLGSPCYSSVSSWTTHENDLTLSADFELFKEIGAPARRVPPQLTSGQTVIKSPDSQMLDEQRVDQRYTKRVAGDMYAQTGGHADEWTYRLTYDTGFDFDLFWLGVVLRCTQDVRDKFHC